MACCWNSIAGGKVAHAHEMDALRLYCARKCSRRFTEAGAGSDAGGFSPFQLWWRGAEGCVVAATLTAWPDTSDLNHLWATLDQAPGFRRDAAT